MEGEGEESQQNPTPTSSQAGTPQSQAWSDIQTPSLGEGETGVEETKEQVSKEQDSEDESQTEPIMSNTNKVQIGGLEYEVTTTPQRAQEDTGILYKGEDRLKLASEKLVEFLDKATRSENIHYNPLNYRLDDPNKLEDTTNLNSTVQRLCKHHTKYDMHHVFENVVIRKIDLKTGNEYYITKNLYEDYPTITEAQVAASNAWYNTLVTGDLGKLRRQDLTVTAEHLSKITEDSLVSKVMETYDAYETHEQGGPLFFKILMDTLQVHSKEAADYIIKTIESLDLAKIDGENVAKANSLIRGGIARLRNLKDENGKSYLPDDMSKKLVAIYRTASVEEFTDLFKFTDTMFRMMRYGGGGSGFKGDLDDVDELTKFAENAYNELVQSGKWNGVQAKANATQFVAQFRKSMNQRFKVVAHFVASNPICFNCGGNHLCKDCTKPRDDERIKKNRQEFWNK